MDDYYQLFFRLLHLFEQESCRVLSCIDDAGMLCTYFLSIPCAIAAYRPQITRCTARALRRPRLPGRYRN
jgi:hypothetical protein